MKTSVPITDLKLTDPNTSYNYFQTTGGLYIVYIGPYIRYIMVVEKQKSVYIFFLLKTNSYGNILQIIFYEIRKILFL